MKIRAIHSVQRGRKFRDRFEKQQDAPLSGN